MLLQTAAKTEGYTARPIYTGQGTYIPKPTVSTTGVIVISVLLFAQLIGLAYLAWYMYTVPTWTPMLDALAVARITNSLEKTAIPAIGSMSSKDLQHLDSLDGLVGVVETHADEVGVGHEDREENGKTVELGLGASGLFTRRLVKFRVKRGAMRTEMECQCEGCRRRRIGPENSSIASSTY
ncbi:hypothetical protein IQ07DRAFT_586343 [Pyrenochaeta sp. DS3sAY3a]|nr:hypothetical protein IQ07DRAFT_586343 [Pyrenochaeta sp. DS3sAY3a]